VPEKLLDVLEKKLSAEQAQALNREAAYFRNYKDRLDYPEVKRQGMPLGSGAMGRTMVDGGVVGIIPV